MQVGRGFARRASGLYVPPALVSFSRRAEKRARKARSPKPKTHGRKSGPVRKRRVQVARITLIERPKLGEILSFGRGRLIDASIGGSAVTPALQFYDWSTATGGSDNAIQDGGKPLPLVKQSNATDLDVVACSSLSGTNGTFPANMTNCLRHKFPGGVGRAAYVRMINGFSTLSVGDYFYYRYYYRTDYPNTDEAFGASHHFFEGDNSDHGGGDNEIRSHLLSKGGNADDGTHGPFFLAENSGSPNNNWYINTEPNFGNSAGKQVTTRLAKAYANRYEIRVHIASSTKFGFAIRIYDHDDTTLLHEDGTTGLTKLVNGNGTNITTFGENFVMATSAFGNSMDWWSTWQWGNNGGTNYSTECYDYYGGVCFRNSPIDVENDIWCGPYSSVNG